VVLLLQEQQQAALASQVAKKMLQVLEEQALALFLA
jgi:hypothetical protein